MADGSVVAGPVVKAVKGGLIVSLGVKAFMPASQIEQGRANELSAYVGSQVRVHILEIDRARNNVVVSRRSVLESDARRTADVTLASLEPGTTREARVLEPRVNGLRVDIDGLEVFLRREDVHVRGGYRRSNFQPDMKLMVHICDIQRGERAVALKLIESEHDTVERPGAFDTGPQFSTWVAYDDGRLVVDAGNEDFTIDALGDLLVESSERGIERVAIECAGVAMRSALRARLKSGDFPEVDYSRSRQLGDALLLVVHRRDASQQGRSR